MALDTNRRNERPPMFELTDYTPLRLKKTNPRKEHHGEDLVQAIDLDLEWETVNTNLAMLSPALLGAFYCRDDQTEAQGEIDGVEQTFPNLRLVKLEWPVRWDLELEGRNLVIHHGLGGRSDLVLSTCTVKKFRISCKEGGTVVIGFQVQANVDITEKIVGKLCSLEGEDVEATLMASEDAQDEPGLPTSPTPTDIFTQQHSTH